MIQPVKEKIILGIDPGTTIMGYGVLRIKGTKPEMIAMGIIDLRKFANHYLKLRHIHERVLSIIESYLPDELAIEAPFFEERSFNSQFIRQIAFNNTQHPLMDMAQFQVMIGKLTQVDNPHSNHFWFGSFYSQHSISHDCRTGVYPQNYLLFYRLNHSITSINVGNPITLSLNILVSSSFNRIPCSKCQRCNNPLLSTSHCKE